jgi:hypothetical protein
MQTDLMDTQSEKLAVLQISSNLTLAAMIRAGGEGPGVVPVDPTNQDPQQRAIDLDVWDVNRAYYQGVVGILKDDVNWPPPPVVTNPTNGPNGALGAVLADPAVSAFIAASPQLAKLAAILHLAAPLVPPPLLPNPGVGPTPVAGAPLVTH